MSETRALRIAVHVGGSIAAYRACDVVTALRREGVEVRVAMTRAAQRLITPTALRSVSGAPVITSLWRAEGDGGHGMTHLTLATWCDAQVVVAASADLCTRLALGLADDAVTATALASRAPLIVAPAMESAMWEHAATQASVETLRARGATLVGPVAGRLASGHEGEGRLADVADIVAAVMTAAHGAAGNPGRGGSAGEAADHWLDGAHVVVTAGGTREPIDPVRYIGNRSSGLMGSALAMEALRLGARVTLVTTVAGPPPRPHLERVPVDTADEMNRAVRAALGGGADILVMAAAVADQRPATVSSHKLKKADGLTHLDLVPTVDILASLRDDGLRRGVTVVGFAAETNDLLVNAGAKLTAKDLDLVVANRVGDDGVGIGAADNAVTVIGRSGIVAEVPRAPKQEVAKAVFEAIHLVRRQT